MFKVVFDTNVYISAILTSGTPRKILVSPSFTLSVVERDKSDDRILECALEAKGDYIISGDSHLLSLKEYQGIKILSPAEFLKLFL